MNNLNQPRTELHKKQNTDNLSKIINRTVDNRRGNMLDMTDGRKIRGADYSGKRTIYPMKGSRRISPREFANSQAKRFIKVATNPGKKYRLPKVNTADKIIARYSGFFEQENISEQPKQNAGYVRRSRRAHLWQNADNLLQKRKSANLAQEVRKHQVP